MSIVFFPVLHNLWNLQQKNFKQKTGKSEKETERIEAVLEEIILRWFPLSSSFNLFLL